MNKYKLILFDMDGTIANTDELVVSTFFEMYDLYRDGKRTSREDCYYFSGPPIRESLSKEFPHQDLEFMVNEFYRLSKDKYDTMVTSYPSCRETLLKLKEKGIKLGVVTNKYHKAMLHCLDVINLRDVMDIAIGFDDVSKGKPDPEGILKALKYFNIKKEDTLYVGDNPLDDPTGKNAEVDTCLVTWGPRKFPKNIKPTYFISAYPELLEVD